MLKFSFCPKCGNKVTQKDGVVKCNSCGRTTYLHSFSTGSVFVIKNGKVLMGKRGDEPLKGYWDILGGFLHFAEHPKDGAIRELKEETGLNIRILDFLGIYMDTYTFQGRPSQL